MDASRHLLFHITVKKVLGHATSIDKTYGGCKPGTTSTNYLPRAAEHLQPRCYRDPGKHKSGASSTETKVLIFDDPIGTFHCIVPVDRTKNMELHSFVQYKDTKRPMHGWQQGTGIAGKYEYTKQNFLTCIQSSSACEAAAWSALSQPSIKLNNSNRVHIRYTPLFIAQA